jgi:hypothetical protein
MPDNKLPQRTFATTFWLAAFFALVFAVRGQIAISFGLSIGAAIGLFSLGTLIVAIPRLAKPGNYWAKFFLGLIWLIKLPVYAVTLNFAMTSWLVEPFAVFVGVALVPSVVVLKVVGYQLLQKTAVTAGE